MTGENSSRNWLARGSAAVTAASKTRRKSKPLNSDWAAGDGAKYFSYREAWARIKLARRHGYFLEAVTIEESIVSDRLMSFLEKSCGVILKDATKFNLSQVAISWVKEFEVRLVTDGIALADAQGIHQRLDAWRNQRNRVVHGMVKSKAGRGDDHIDNFLAEAAIAAADGEKVAREISRWVDAFKKRQSPT